MATAILTLLISSASLTLTYRLVAAQPVQPSVSAYQRSVIFPASQGHLMISEAVDSYWTPTHAEAHRLEIDLSRRPSANGIPLPPGLLGYYKQYFGVVIRGRHYIYVNGFSPAVLRDYTGGTHDWHHQPVIVSDGGNGFFHVIYDPRSRRFYYFDFNGMG